MTHCFRVIALLICCCLPSLLTAANGLSDEYVTTTPVVDDGVLYIASFDGPWRHGHLRAIDIDGTIANLLWDAAERVPLPGTGSDPGGQRESDPPDRIDRDNRYRSLLTNLDGALVPLAATEAGRLQSALGVNTEGESVSLLHALRGRGGLSPTQPSGSFDIPFRLGAFSRSSPALVGRSPTYRTERDRVLYLGAEDGMLHAILASRWDADNRAYLVNDPAGGTELWGYLPGSFLPHLKDSRLTTNIIPAPLHLDGSPTVADVFVAPAAGGRRRWHTLLATSGTVTTTRQSCLFVMDISDPYQPRLVWESLLPGIGMGRSRGITFIPGGQGADPVLYLTADFAIGTGQSGVLAGAVEATTGRLLWQFSAVYDLLDPVVNATPAPPAMMDRDGDGDHDTLLFGDMAGRLWALDHSDGHPLGEAPIYTLPAGFAEPIGAEVAVRGRLAVFGTGGVEHADDNGRYGVYAFEILPDGGRLLWSYPLAIGEKVWSAPSFDASGNLYFATAIGYLQGDQLAASTSGRMVTLDRTGVEKLSRATDAATIGRVITAPDLAVTVALTGEVTQLGAAGRTGGAASASPGSVKILSWRQR